MISTIRVITEQRTCKSSLSRRRGLLREDFRGMVPVMGLVDRCDVGKGKTCEEMCVDGLLAETTIIVF